MSQVAISGNASGTGVFTIASPNSNSSYTLTLPTVTSTLAVGNQVQPISASIASNAITVSASLLTLDFRSTTLTSGTVTTVSGTPASLVIASTDSFGLVTAAGSQRIAILAINNSGTIELAASALYGGVSLDETGVITTSTTATTSTAIKAANARTGVAYRVIGFLDATFTTATGWGSLARVQGQGGEALSAMSSLGYGQTYQDVTASRASGTTYYNTTNRPIFVFITAQAASGNTTYLTPTIGGVAQLSGNTYCSSASYGVQQQFIVPAGQSYLITAQNIGSINRWLELR
jgi:hypothetical protein